MPKNLKYEGMPQEQLGKNEEKKQEGKNVEKARELTHNFYIEAEESCDAARRGINLEDPLQLFVLQVASSPSPDLILLKDALYAADKTNNNLLSKAIRARARFTNANEKLRMILGVVYSPDYSDAGDNAVRSYLADIESYDMELDD